MNLVGILNRLLFLSTFRGSSLVNQTVIDLDVAWLRLLVLIIELLDLAFRSWLIDIVNLLVFVMLVFGNVFLLTRLFNFFLLSQGLFDLCLRSSLSK